MTQEKKLLTHEELSACQQVTSLDNLHGKRARALLAVNEGKTQADAGKQTGLTKGQIRYLLTRFGQKRMSIFPASVVDALQTPQEEIQLKEKVSEELKADQKATKKEKNKKAKKKPKKEKQQRKKDKKSKKKKNKPKKQSKKKEKSKKKGKKGKKDKKK